MARLKFKINGELQEVPLEPELTIGRGYSNLLRLDGAEISRVHAIIYKLDDKFVLRDLDSKNGVFLNGLKVSSAELNSGDEIRIGKYVLSFDAAAKPENAAAPMRSFAGTPTPHAGGAINTDADLAAPEDKFAGSMVFAPPPTPRRNSNSPSVARGLGEEIVFLTAAELAEVTRGDNPVVSPAVLQLEASIMENFLAAINRTDLDHGLSFVEQVLSALAHTLEASSGAVILSDAAESRYSPLAIYPPRDDLAVNRIVMREGFSQRRAMLCPLTAECGLFRESTTVTRDKIITLLALPVSGGAGRPGVLYLDRKGEEAEPFLMTDLIAAARVARILELHLHAAAPLATAGEPV